VIENILLHIPLFFHLLSPFIVLENIFASLLSILSPGTKSDVRSCTLRQEDQLCDETRVAREGYHRSLMGLRAGRLPLKFDRLGGGEGEPVCCGMGVQSSFYKIEKGHQ
jgi:hypothetical protein